MDIFDSIFTKNIIKKYDKQWKFIQYIVITNIKKLKNIDSNWKLYLYRVHSHN